jgi:hypothetical protein
MHVEVAGLAVLTAVFLVTARSALRRMELAARREGVLGDRE